MNTILNVALVGGGLYLAYMAYSSSASSASSATSSATPTGSESSFAGAGVSPDKPQLYSKKKSNLLYKVKKVIFPWSKQ